MPFPVQPMTRDEFHAALDHHYVVTAPAKDGLADRNLWERNDDRGFTFESLWQLYSAWFDFVSSERQRKRPRGRPATIGRREFVMIWESEAKKRAGLALDVIGARLCAAFLGSDDEMSADVYTRLREKQRSPRAWEIFSTRHYKS